LKSQEVQIGGSKILFEHDSFDNTAMGMELALNYILKRGRSFFIEGLRLCFRLKRLEGF